MIDPTLFTGNNTTMKSLSLPLLIAFLFHLPLSAEETVTEKKLARALKLFPDADLDENGILSPEEAQKYLGIHPELKAIAETGKPSKTPGDLTTPASKGLPAGPRVFVCAHSFMIYTASLLPPMVEAAGIGYQDAGKQMIGGSRVIQHWDLPDEKNRAKAALTSGAVDVLTVSPHVEMPDPGIENFARLGLEKNPNMRILVQASWPARDGVIEPGFKNETRNESTLESLREMHKSYHELWFTSLESQVKELNASFGKEAVFIVPVCDAVLALREHIVSGTAPGLTRQTDLFRDPLGHPLPPLAALVTYCHFSGIYGESPIGLPVPKELASMDQAAELNALLQKIAWDAVSSYPMSGVKKEAPAAVEAQ